MPRLYVTTDELNESPAGVSMAGSISLLSVVPLTKLLFKASQRVDSYCGRRVQCIGSTTISGSTQIVAGSTSIPVASTLTFDNKDEQAVTIDTGGNQETILIQPGGVSVTSYTSPYPGTLTLATPTAYAHNAGVAVVGCYKETSEVGGVSTSDDFSASLITQQAQIAEAHMPRVNLRNLARVIWLRNRPIISISTIEHAYSFVNTFNTLLATVVSQNNHDGWYRFNTGTVITPEGLIRTTYTGGYQVIPDDVKEATILYATDLLMDLQNPGRAIDVRRGKVAFRYAGHRNKSRLVEDAECILKDGGYRRIV